MFCSTVLLSFDLPEFVASQQVLHAAIHFMPAKQFLVAGFCTSVCSVEKDELDIVHTFHRLLLLTSVCHLTN